MKTILIPQTGFDVHGVLKRILAPNEYTLRVERATDRHILEVIEQIRPDLMVLDSTALGLCTAVRKNRHTIPIICVGPDTHEQRVVQALDLGADDYVPYPWNLGELAARIRAKLRATARSRAPVEEVPHRFASHDGYLCLNTQQHEVTVDGQRVHLPKTVFDVLHYLMAHADNTVPHPQLLRHIWGEQYERETEYLRAYIRQLRSAIELNPSHPSYILTKPGLGYRFCSDPNGSQNTQNNLVSTAMSQK